MTGWGFDRGHLTGGGAGNDQTPVKLPGVDEHVEDEAPELALFVVSVDKKTCDGLRRWTHLSSAVVVADCQRRVANYHHLIDEKRYLETTSTTPPTSTSAINRRQTNGNRL